VNPALKTIRTCCHKGLNPSPRMALITAVAGRFRTDEQHEPIREGSPHGERGPLSIAWTDEHAVKRNAGGESWQPGAIRSGGGEAEHCRCPVGAVGRTGFGRCAEALIQASGTTIVSRRRVGHKKEKKVPGSQQPPWAGKAQHRRAAK
jgi:hypothetical protein